MAAGWIDYESRWKRPTSSKVGPQLNVPHWSGEPLQGRSILVYAEQGLGDIFMCCRFLLRLLDQGAEVLFFGAGELSRLLQSMSASIRYVDKVPDRVPDFQIALMSLPYRLKADLGNLPSHVPYLFADPDRTAHWRGVLGPDGFKIGINWQGNPDAEVDLGRSIPLREFYPLSQIPGVRLIGLQKHAGLGQLANLPSGMKVEMLESSGTDGFIDTAAVMQNMDLIVSSDTSVANLAGAMGLRGWIALKHVPDWRWLTERTDSPWYPSLRLFRQKTPGEWSPVFADIATRLKAHLQ